MPCVWTCDSGVVLLALTEVLLGGYFKLDYPGSIAVAVADVSVIAERSKTTHMLPL